MADAPFLPSEGVTPSQMADPTLAGAESDKALELVQVLGEYRTEAVDARRAGPNSRDEKWDENLNLYWNRWDFSDKADWQAQEAMPEVPGFVDRFAAAMKDAMLAVPEGFYTIIDPADVERDMVKSIKRITDCWLSRCGRDMKTGQLLGFDSVFEEQMKLGAMMACSAAVTWRNDPTPGRVSVETVDPRNVWLDPTYRSLYRIRRMEVDKHELVKLASLKTGRGKPLYDTKKIKELQAFIATQDVQRRKELTGSSDRAQSNREPVTLDEYVATVVSADGKILADNALMVVANDRWLIRGPEKLPFWHGNDWLLFTPLVTVPLSPYGRTYMEDFGSIAKVYNDMTNLILDATYTSSQKVFATIPEMLTNPGQLESGLYPGKRFDLEMGMGDAKGFMAALDLGTLPPDAFNVWTAMKNELREAADINEIGLGQFAPRGRTSATEISATQQSSSALVRSVAQTCETRFLDPLLDLVWKTGVQYMSKNDKVVEAACDTQWFQAILAQRKDFVSRPITFQARGISTLIARSQQLKAIISILQLIASNPQLTQAFLQVANLQRLVELMFELSNIDLRRLQITEREQMMQSVMSQLQGAQQDGQPGASAGGQQQMQDVAGAMGVGQQGGGG